MTTWNDAKVHRLMVLRDEGLTATEIGKTLGVSRNAVIGKLNRLGFSLAKPAGTKHPNQSGRTRKARPEPSMPEVRAAQPDIEPDIEPEPQPEPVPMEETAPEPESGPAAEPEAETARGAAAAVMALQPRSCRWPVGDPQDADFRFCGRPRGRGAWCAEHASAAWTTVKDESLKEAS